MESYSDPKDHYLVLVRVNNWVDEKGELYRGQGEGHRKIMTLSPRVYSRASSIEAGLRTIDELNERECIGNLPKEEILRVYNFITFNQAVRAIDTARHLPLESPDPKAPRSKYYIPHDISPAYESKLVNIFDEALLASVIVA